MKYIVAITVTFALVVTIAIADAVELYPSKHWSYTTEANPHGFTVAYTKSINYENLELTVLCQVNSGKIVMTLETEDKDLLTLESGTRNFNYQFNKDKPENIDLFVGNKGRQFLTDDLKLIYNLIVNDTWKIRWQEESRTIYPVFSLSGSSEAIVSALEPCTDPKPAEGFYIPGNNAF